MAGFAELLRPVATLLVDFFGDGELVTLRAPNRLYDRLTQAMIAADALRLRSNAALGAASLTLERPAAARLGGTIWQGSTLTIAGQATAYTTTATAEVADDRVTVSVSPVLTASALAGAVVTLSADAAHQYPRARTEFDTRDVDNERIFGSDNIFALSAEGPGPPPQEGWIVEEVGQEIIKVTTVAPGAQDNQVAWILHTGRARSRA